MRRAAAIVSVTILATVVALAGAASPGRRQVSVAAASNLTEAFHALGVQFEAETGIHPVFSFASTAQLARQVENGAPFDVIAGADTDHIASLDMKGLLLPGSRDIYAMGVLALWVPTGSRAKIESLADVAGPNVRVIAIAKPELAPYGQAAVETLQHAGLWDKVRARVVYGENISAVRQYGASGNADAVFTALSLVLKAQGKVLRIDDAQHKPIAQALGIVASAKHPKEARAFTEFLLRGKGRQMLAAHGYGAPR